MKTVHCKEETLFALLNINMMCKVPCMLSKHLFVFNLGTCCFHFFENSLSLAFIHLFACSMHCCVAIVVVVAADAPSKNKVDLKPTANITNVVIYLNF